MHGMARTEHVGRSKPHAAPNGKSIVQEVVVRELGIAKHRLSGMCKFQQCGKPTETAFGAPVVPLHEKCSTMVLIQWDGRADLVNCRFMMSSFLKAACVLCISSCSDPLSCHINASRNSIIPAIPASATSCAFSLAGSTTRIRRRSGISGTEMSWPGTVERSVGAAEASIDKYADARMRGTTTRVETSTRLRVET